MRGHMLELFLWLLTAFFLGGVIGCLLRQLTAGEKTGARGEPQTSSEGTGISPQEAPKQASAPAAKPSAEEMQGLMGAAPMSQPPSAQQEKEEEKQKDAATSGGQAGTAAEAAAKKTAEEKAAEEKKDAADSAQATASKLAAKSAVKTEEAQEKKQQEAEAAADTQTGKETAAGEATTAASAAQEAPSAAQTTKETAHKEPGKEKEAAAGGESAAQSAESLPAFGLKAPLGGEPDNLQLISGVGPKLEKLLHEMGIYHYAQIAAWTKKDIEEIDSKLKFKGRIERDEWVRQAKLLAAGRMEEFERDYGTGGLKGKDGKARSGARTRKKK